MIPERKSFGPIWTMLFSAAVMTALTVVYTLLSGAAKDRYLLIVTAILVIFAVTVVVWTGRSKTRLQEEDDLDRNRRASLGQTELPMQYHRIYSQVKASLRSRPYYERRLLPRISQLREGKTGDNATETQKRYDTSWIKSETLAFIVEMISGKRVTCEEILKELDRLEDG